MIHKYYYSWIRDNYNNPWIGMSASSKYLSKKLNLYLKNDFDLNCNENADLYLYDDHTYLNVFKNYSGDKISQVTYLMLPHYTVNPDKNIAKNKLDLFLDKNYKKVVFYGSCGFKPELPESFYQTHKNKYEICCFKR